jgi:hypothetical protein
MERRTTVANPTETCILNGAVGTQLSPIRSACPAFLTIEVCVTDTEAGATSLFNGESDSCETVEDVGNAHFEGSRWEETVNTDSHGRESQTESVEFHCQCH